MKQRVEIRPAKACEIPALAALARACFPDPWSERIFRDTLQSPHSAIWCAMQGEMLCGYLVCAYAGDHINIDDIAVHPDFRRQGIGTRLLTYAHEAYPDSPFWLEVRASNLGAQALYQKLGYAQVGRRRRYYQTPTEDAILLTRMPTGRKDDQNPC